MSGAGGFTYPVVAGYPAEALQLVELRTQTGLLEQIAAANGSADNNVPLLRNDEAPVLGLTTPIPSA